MVRLIVPVIGAVAALSSSSFAAPMMKRSTPPSYEYTTPENQESTYESSSYDVESSSYVESSYVESSSTYVVESSSTYSVPESTPVYEGSEYVPSETYVPQPESTYSTPEYGSGWNDWGNSYDDCVQKCVAHYGAPESHEWTPENPTESKDPSTGGAVHTVLVAPVDGVPRFMPFALNATVGDTVRFVWPGTATHSVTMSSELNLCSKSEASNAFDSGMLSGENGEQTFDVTIDSEETKYFYCAAAEGAHCAAGMWGMINPKSAAGTPNTIGGKMNEWVEANPDLKAVWSVVHNSTKDTPADTWGNSISLDGVPEDQYVNIAENVLWNRANFAANPGMQEAGQGASTPDGSPLTLVGDISTLLSANSEPANAAPAPPATETPASSSALPRGVVSGAFVTAVTLLASVFVL